MKASKRPLFSQLQKAAGTIEGFSSFSEFAVKVEFSSRRVASRQEHEGFLSSPCHLLSIRLSYRSSDVNVGGQALGLGGCAHHQVLESLLSMAFTMY